MAIKIKDKETLDMLISLCDYNEEDKLYYSKTGKDFIESYSKIINSSNINDNPFSVEDILKQPTMQDFTFEGIKEFDFICKLKAIPMVLDANNMTKENEKIVVVKDSFASESAKRVYESALGVDYVITCSIDNKEYIIKIGNSRNTFKDRLGSYNCGVITNLRTASTTNIKLLQSFVATRKEFNLYLMDCSDVTTFKWHGVESVGFASPKGLAYEDILIKKFIEQFGKKPLANVQANATVVKK